MSEAFPTTGADSAAGNVQAKKCSILADRIISTLAPGLGQQQRSVVDHGIHLHESSAIIRCFPPDWGQLLSLADRWHAEACMSGIALVTFWIDSSAQIACSASWPVTGGIRCRQMMPVTAVEADAMVLVEAPKLALDPFWPVLPDEPVRPPEQPNGVALTLTRTGLVHASAASVLSHGYTAIGREIAHERLGLLQPLMMGLLSQETPR